MARTDAGMAEVVTSEGLAGIVVVIDVKPISNGFVGEAKDLGNDLR